MVNKELSNTAFLYSDRYFLKIFRRLDDTINPDLELSRFLSEHTDFKNIPKYLGSIQLHEANKQPVVFGMLQEYVPNQGNAWEPFGDAAVNYFERLAVRLQDSTKALKEIKRASPNFDRLPDDWQVLIGAEFSGRVELLAQRTAQMHQTLASETVHADFKPEPFSLHYQRSLYSSLQSTTRSSFQALKRSMSGLTEELQEEGKKVLEIENQVKTIFKRIYAHKIDTKKVRNHGDFHLGQVLWTGRDYIFLDFEGEPQRPFSERRIKRSPLRDVSGMMRSFHYVIYDRLFAMNLSTEKSPEMEKWAEIWYSLVSGIYLNTYLDEMSATGLLPASAQDRKVLIETYLLEKAVYELGYELDHRPEWVKIPLRGVLRIVEKQK
jgi:maltose alpha-D-glucosyltransferase/alpha-amylase